MTEQPEQKTDLEPLLLLPTSGPAVGRVSIPVDGVSVIGRSRDCDVQLIDAAVSRKHATIERRGDHWMLTDAGSRHGTVLNTLKLPPGEPHHIAEGDLIRIDPWLFRVVESPTLGTLVSTVEESSDSRSRVRRIAQDDTARLALHRLELLLDYASVINRADNEAELARAVLDAALAGAGFHRAALLRALSETERDIEVIGYRSIFEDEVSTVQFSRSLVEAASHGELVSLSPEVEPTAHSIVSLAIQQAICAPIYVGAAVAACLYMDIRDSNRLPEPDAVGFCQAIARIAGLAFGNMKRADLQRRQNRLEDELAAARTAQELIMPPENGAVGPILYAVRTRPGRYVAGDLFDVMQLPDGRTAACLGDVSGKGVGAALLMAAAQSHLHSSLLHHDDPASAVAETNRYVEAHSSQGNFISLWVGVFAPGDSTVQYVDAGHGHWLHKPKGEAARTVEHRGGIPLGVDSDHKYVTEPLQLRSDDRIILVSDGVLEQQSPDHEQFGHERLVELLNECANEQEDAERVLRAVEQFAGIPNLADDTTVASLRFGG